jgi:hypothetical protein
MAKSGSDKRAPMMATLAVLEMCSRTRGSLVWIDGPGVVCRKVGPGSRPRWASGESVQRPAMALRAAAIARMTRRSLFPLWVPAIGHCLVSSLVLLETCSLSTLSSFLCLSLLSRPSFFRSSIHPSRHISTPYRTSLLSAPQPSTYGSIIRVYNWPSTVPLIILHYARPRRECALQVANHLCCCCHWYSPRLVCLLQSSP